MNQKFSKVKTTCLLKKVKKKVVNLLQIELERVPNLNVNRIVEIKEEVEQGELVTFQEIKMQVLTIIREVF